MTVDYKTFLESKRIRREPSGFKATFLPDCLMPFQKHLTEWAVGLGKAADLADCGLGKSLLALVWCENIIRNRKPRRALIVTPLAVAEQFEREAAKFGLSARKTKDGTVHDGVNVTNYERLHNYRPEDFCCIVIDESGILKNFEGKYRKYITSFMSSVEYRLLCSATPAPNDYMELGNSSEALGDMTRNQMLVMFFVNDGETTQQWNLKGHAKKRFWQWVSSWARAVRKPSDLGYDDAGFVLPELMVHQHVLPSGSPRTGFFPDLANTLSQQRTERNRTVGIRCARAAELVPKDRPCVLWCHLNREGEELSRSIPGAVEVRGSDRDEVKEERLTAFSTGQIRVLVTKPRIAGHGLNWQHCADLIYFPSHSHEAYYQAIRRCWRFGQKNPVNCHLIAADTERMVMENMMRKEKLSIEMYEGICREMGKFSHDAQSYNGNGAVKVDLPGWLGGKR